MAKNTTKTEKLREIRNEILELKESALCEERVKHGYYPVIGEGNHDADILFIGEAPGKNEAEQGRPFCGRAGKLLDELLESVNIPRTDVYITNIIKDRPPKNRDPLPEEIELYAPFLDRQIEIIQPSVIATLGRYAMEYILKKFELEEQLEPISKAHGKLYTVDGLFGSIQIVPLYHPAAAIYTRSLIDTLKKDFEILTQFYKPSKKS